MNPGFAFGDHIKTEKIKRRLYSEPSKFRIRGYFLLLFLVVVVVLCIGRLGYLQLFRGDYYRALSDSNRIRTEVIYAPRGIIFDRTGVPLVRNSPGFRQTFKDSGGTRSVLLSREQAIPLMAAREKNIAVDSLREYPYKEAMANVLGYTGQVSEADLRGAKYANADPNDFIGKTGIEERYERLLAGQNGKQLVEVDALGRSVRSLGQADPVAGDNITLTLDARLQQAAYTAASDIAKGAVIVARPNGEILAMVSKPSYDPNLFTMDSTYSVSSRSAYKSVGEVLRDEQNQPLLNRAIGGVYPPGSTFKLVVAAAGLEQRRIDGNYTVEDTGVLKVGDFSFANWYYTQYGKTEPGELNVVRALARSNDIFFYKLAERVGVDKISEMADKFGVGRVTGIDLPGEAKGVLPSKKWKEEVIKDSWYLGDTFHYGIGQGFLLTTPLQVNMWTAGIANGGVLPVPHLLLNENGGHETGKFLSESTISLIREGMIDSCKPGGVAWPLFNFKVKNSKLPVDGKNFLEVKTGSDSAVLKDYREVSVACKTGTAEHGGEDTLPHAWITLYAPAYNPEVVVTVLNESSGEGSSKAGPVADKILESYFSMR
jgi:penicillin-binding protein 2